MSTRKLAGWFLTIGPIGLLLIFGFLRTALLGTGQDDLPDVVLQATLDNRFAASLTGLLGGVSFFAVLVGFGMLALEARAGSGAGSALGSASTVIFPAVLGVSLANWGLTKGAPDVALKEGLGFDAGSTTLMIATEIGSGLGVLWGLGLVSLGIAMAFQKMLPVILGWLLAVAGALLFVNVWVDNSVIGLVSWIGFTVITVAVGIASLRTQETG